MAKEEWGIKRQCLSCGARFYDLKKKPIICIKCETVFVPEPLLKSRRWQGGAAKPVVEKPAVVKEESETEGVAAEGDNNAGSDNNAESDNAEDDGAGATLIANDDDDDDDLSDVVASPAKTETDG